MKTSKAKPSAKHFAQAAPYTVEEAHKGRDLWTIRTAHNLVIGPIYGRGTADLLAAAPDLQAALRWLVEECTNGDGSGTVNAIGAARRALEISEGQADIDYETASKEAEAYYAKHPEVKARVDASFKRWWGKVKNLPPCECGLDDVTPKTCPMHKALAKGL